MIRATIIVLVLLLGTSASRAELYDLADPVAGHPGRTWFDAARAIVTDLTMTGEQTASGEVVIPVRHLVDGYGGRPPARVELRQVLAWSYLADGHDWTLALFDLGHGDDRFEPTVIAAVFDERLRLVDAADIATGSNVGVETLPFRVSNWADAVVFHSEFGNSMQRASQYSLVIFRNGRLQLVDMISTLDSNECAQSRYQSIDVISMPTAGDRGFWPIEIAVTDTLDVDLTVTCEGFALPEAYEKTVSVIYRWDDFRGAYLPDSDALHQVNTASSESN